MTQCPAATRGGAIPVTSVDEQRRSREAELVRRAQAGDRPAFEQLYRDNVGRVYALCFRMAGTADLAEELAQDVFLQLYQNLSQIQSPRHLTFWLRRITSHRCIDHARRHGYQRPVSLEQVPEPAAVVGQDDPLLQGRLERLVASLPERARMVIILRYQEDLEYHEIAEALDMPLNTVKSSLQRALGILRGKLARTVGGVHA